MALGTTRLNAYGAMTCQNSTVLHRLRPVGSGSTAVNLPSGSPLNLSVLNINCAAPAGPVYVTVQPGNTKIPLLDDGKGADLAAGDGVYSAAWIPPHAGGYTLIFPGNDPWEATVFPAYTYTVVPFSWQQIDGANLNLSDDSIATIALPFPIVIGGVSFPTVYVDSNGKLDFQALIESEYNNLPLPNALADQYMVAPFWDDLLPIQNTAQNVFWAVTGTAPHRRFVVEWRNVSRADGCTDSAAQITFQAVFTEGSTDILFDYADTTFGGPARCAAGDHGGSATVGIQTVAPIGTQFSYNRPVVADHMSIKFSLVP